MSYKSTTADDILTLFPRPTKQKQVFEVLSDTQWHCRPCVNSRIQMDQIAGGGGIQGLQRGTKSRPGLEIEKKRNPCARCGQSTTHDRWTGRARFNVVAGDLPDQLKQRIGELYGLKDPLTGTTLNPQNVIVDHRLPRQRWGSDYQPPMQLSTSDEELKVHYQILRNSKDNNENLRKSRACEACGKTGVRQSPLNLVKFFYEGGEQWPSDVPVEGEAAMEGCIGCGWFDVLQLLERLHSNSKNAPLD